MQKIRCLLVDDEPLALDAMATLTGKIPELEVIGRCKDAVEALQVIHQKKIDLLFLDINMPELSGLEMLRSLTNPPRVIFTTAYREYAVEAFELDVVDYLVKPVSFERLLKSINRYHDRIRTNSKEGQAETTDEAVTFYSDKKTYKINTSEILFIEGLKDYALVHTKSNRIITRQTMKNLEAMLSSYHFIRVHRSWIVPYQRLSSWTSYSVNIGEKEIPIGKTYRKSIQEYLVNKHS